MNVLSWLKISALFLFLHCTGCSRAVVAYNFGDTLMAYKIDDYFDLNSSQKKILKAELKTQFESAKSEILPQIAEDLEKILPLVDQPTITTAVLAEKVDLVQGHFKNIMLHFKSTAQEISGQLLPEQMEHFKERVAEDVKKIQKKTTDADGIWINSLERYEKFLTFCFGYLTSDQEKSLKAFLKANPLSWDLETRNRQSVLDQWIKAFPEKAQRLAFTEKYFNDYETVRLPEYKEALRIHRQAFQAYIAQEFWPSLEKNQRKHFKAELVARIEQIKKIRAQ